MIKTILPVQGFAILLLIETIFIFIHGMSPTINSCLFILKQLAAIYNILFAKLLFLSEADE